MAHYSRHLGKCNINSKDYPPLEPKSIFPYYLESRDTSVNTYICICLILPPPDINGPHPLTFLCPLYDINLGEIRMANYNKVRSLNKDRTSPIGAQWDQAIIGVHLCKVFSCQRLWGENEFIKNKYDPPLSSRDCNACQEVSKSVSIGKLPNVLIEIEHLI